VMLHPRLVTHPVSVAHSLSIASPPDERGHMTRWAAYDERGGAFIGFVEAQDRDGAIAAAVAKFRAIPSLAYVERMPDLPREVPIDAATIKRFEAVPPAKEKRSPTEMLDDALVPIGMENWRDGPRDDGSLDSDDILPDH
jgi:hypothetical protein